MLVILKSRLGVQMFSYSWCFLAISWVQLSRGLILTVNARIRAWGRGRRLFEGKRLVSVLKFQPQYYLVFISSEHKL